MVSKRGITLIENMAAVVLLGILITALVFSFAAARMYAASARHKYAAISFARERIEGIIQAGITVGDTAPPDESVILDPRTAAAGDELSGTLSYIYDIDGVAMTANITVSVDWTEEFFSDIANNEMLSVTIEAQAAP